MKLITIVLPRLKTEFEYRYLVVKRVGFTRLWAQRDKTPPRFLDIYIIIFLEHVSKITHNSGFQVRSRAGRWSWTLNPEEIMSREVELGCEGWTSFASGCSSTAVQRTLS